MNKKRINQKIFIILIILGLFSFAFLDAYNYDLYADFVPVNGDFQNYNPIRRFISGQTPFVDFEVYLGMGHLLVGSFFTVLLGNNFQASIYAMRVATFLAFEITVYMLLRGVLESNKRAAIITLFLSAINCINVITALPINVNIILSGGLQDALEVTRDPGNSARVLRSSICVIAPLLIICVVKWISEKLEHKKISTQMIRHICMAIVGGVTGLAVFWSNDFGISTALVVLLLSGVVCIKIVIQKKEKFKDLLLDAIFAISGLGVMFVIGASVITRGHPLKYLITTSQVREYQSWYAVHNAEGKAYYIWDLFISEPQVILGIIMCGIYLFFLLRGSINMKKIIRYGIPASALGTSIFVLYLYRFSDGGGDEYYWLVFISVLIAELIRLISEKESILARKRTNIIAYSLIGSIFIAQFGTFIQNRLRIDMKGTYVAGLGGYLTELGDTILNTQDYLQDKKVFNTYASAVETVTNQYQPSGVDYIIHVLGDKCREDYMDAFHKSNTDYVGILRQDYYRCKWEGYLKGVNWFFYRDMLDNYVIEFSNDYQDYYSKADSRQKTLNIDAEIEVIQDRTDTYTIKLKYPDNTYNGLADVGISYKIEKTTAKRNVFCFKNLGFVSDSNYPDENRYYYDFPLPGGEQTTYIPIVVKNGEGMITFTSHPQNYTELTIEDIEVQGLFQNALDIAQIKDVTQDVNGRYIVSVSGDRLENTTPPMYIQNVNRKAKVIDTYTDGMSTYYVINDEKFATQLTPMISSIKIYTR